MKFVELSCPHCGGQLNLHDDRRYAECIYCGQKSMIIEDKAVDVDLKARQVDPMFEKLRYAIVSDDHFMHADSFIRQKYKRLKSRGKKHNEALMACANSMCRMIWKMVTSGRKYVADPELLAQTRSYVNSDGWNWIWRPPRSKDDMAGIVSRINVRESMSDAFWPAEVVHEMGRVTGRTSGTRLEVFKVGNKLAILRHFRTPSRMVRIPANYAILCG